MNFSFHPDAETEFHDSIDYYEACEKGLGHDFSLEVCSAIQSIIEHPTAWPVLEEDVRRCLTNRFPYGVLYSIQQDGIFILAIMHLHRDADYWKSRMT